MVSTDVWFAAIAWDDFGSYEFEPTWPVRLTDNAGCFEVNGTSIGERYCKRVCERTTAEGVCVTKQRSELHGRSGAANPVIAIVPHSTDVASANYADAARILVA